MTKIHSRAGVLALLFGVNLLNYIDRYVLPGVLPLIEKAFLGISKESQGNLALAFIWIYMLTSPIFGLLGDRFPRKSLIGLGVQLWSLATAAGGMVRSFWQLFVSRMFVGIGEAAYGTMAPTIISDLYPKEYRGRALSFFYIAIPLGAALGYLFGGVIGTHFGWRAAFFVVGIPGLLVGFLIYWIREPQRGASEEVNQCALQKYNDQKVCVRDYLELIRIPSYMLNTLGMTAYTYAVGGISWWLPTYLCSERGVPLGRASFLVGAITAATGILGTMAGGFLADRFTKHLRGAYFLLCGISMLLATPFLYWTLKTQTLLAVWVAIAITEFLLFLSTGPSNTIIVNVTQPRIRTTAFAVNIFVIHALGDGISPKIMGAIADRSNLTSAFMVTNAVIALSGLFWLLGTPFLRSDMERVTKQINAG